MEKQAFWNPAEMGKQPNSLTQITSPLRAYNGDNIPLLGLSRESNATLEQGFSAQGSVQRRRSPKGTVITSDTPDSDGSCGNPRPTGRPPRTGDSPTPAVSRRRSTSGLLETQTMGTRLPQGGDVFLLRGQNSWPAPRFRSLRQESTGTPASPTGPFQAPSLPFKMTSRHPHTSPCWG